MLTTSFVEINRTRSPGCILTASAESAHIDAFIIDLTARDACNDIQNSLPGANQAKKYLLQKHQTQISV
jgi:hypothetical protein